MPIQVPVLAENGRASAPTQHISIEPVINLTASGGTPAQNKELAGHVSAAITEQMRGLIVGEMAQQLRHGGLLSRAMGR